MQNITEQPTFLHHSEAICLVVLCSVLLTIGCLGNLVTIAALVQCKKLRTSTTALVVNLSFADALFSIFVMPMRAAMIIEKSRISCGIFLFFFYGSVTTSLMTMVAIAISRFSLVVYNDVYQKLFTNVGTAIMIACVWIYSYGIWSVPLSGLWGKFENHEGTPFCRLVEEITSPKLFLGLFGFVLPLLVITSAYIAVFVSIHRSNKKFPANTTSATSISNRKRQREMNVTRVLVVAYCSFLVFFLPNFIILMIPSIRENPIALTVGEVLLWLSSCSNPFIYVLCSNSYSQAYKQLFNLNRQDGNRVSFFT